MKKLLIAGGGYADIPLIQAAKKLGYYVITSGNRAEDMGHAYSDECQLEDFSNKEAICNLAKRLQVDAICACCNDFSALSASYAAEQLGLPGHDPFATAVILHHKDEYRNFALEQGIPTPHALGFHDAKEALQKIQAWRLPLIVKPVDLTGGKGISKIESLADAPAALEKALQTSKAKHAVVEEFIEGTRHGFSAFLRKGKVVFHFTDNEYYYKNPYLVSAASTPSSVSKFAVENLIQQSEKIAGILSLKDGIFHVQFILRDGEPIIIEITRRAPGDLYIKLVQHATGIDYPSWIVQTSAGLGCDGLSQVDPKGFFTRHCLMAAKEGQVREIRYAPGIKEKIIDEFLWGKPGDRVADIMTNKFGIVFLQFNKLEEMLDQTQRMQELIFVDVA